VSDAAPRTSDASPYAPACAAPSSRTEASRTGEPGATLPVAGSTPRSSRVIVPCSAPARSVTAFRTAHSPSARALSVRSVRRRASTPNSHALARLDAARLVRTVTGARAAIQRVPRSSAADEAREWKGPSCPAVLTIRRASSRSTRAVARSSLSGVGAATSEATASSDRGAPSNSSARPCVARSAAVFDTRALAQPPTRLLIGTRAVALACTRLRPARSPRSRGRPSVSISSTPESASPWRAEKPPLE
jgi:hypothetical protein